MHVIHNLSKSCLIDAKTRMPCFSNQSKLLRVQIMLQAKLSLDHDVVRWCVRSNPCTYIRRFCYSKKAFIHFGHPKIWVPNVLVPFFTNPKWQFFTHQSGYTPETNPEVAIPYSQKWVHAQNQSLPLWRHK